MTREEAIFCEKSYIGETNCTDCKYYGTDTCQSRESHKMAVKALEQESTTKEDLGVDAVSRQALIDWLKNWTLGDASPLIDFVKSMPPVTPQEPKIGHWTEEFNDLEGEVRFTCSSCGKYQLFGTDFCYHCGSDNREVKE